MRTVTACLAGLSLLVSATASHAVFTFNDITYWVGSGANEAALVIDWIDPIDATQDISLAWGYRFDGSATGLDMMNAIIAADARLDFVDGGGGYIYDIGFDADADGTNEYFHPNWVDPNYWGQYEADGVEPYNGGLWTSGLGVASHNLSDGSWPGWRHTSWGAEGPR